MEDMLRKIVEADEAAKAVDEKNRAERVAFEKEIEAKANEIYNSYMTKAYEEVEKNNLCEESKAKKLFEETRQKQKSASVKLKADFEANCEKWSDEIVKRTIG
ncbi:MAG: hypothetical protein UH080_01535 [Ruminococcus sp.]|nr:hypothetical protein [Ruminococcus sp.]